MAMGRYSEMLHHRLDIVFLKNIIEAYLVTHNKDLVYFENKIIIFNYLKTQIYSQYKIII